jgi:hypothetical protein
MALGKCRFCGAGRIAPDAPTCRECGGWYPNPGVFTQVNAAGTKVVALVFLAIAGLCMKYLGSDYVVYTALFSFLGLVTLLKSLIRPYGKPMEQ